MAEFRPVSEVQSPCKCCGRPAPLFGVLDFNKSCEDHNVKPFPLCGVPVYYYRCATCGFIFTTTFDGFTPKDWTDYIYNERYARVDPEYLDIRPRRMAHGLAQILNACRDLRILDYGGGNGLLAATLRQAGFSRVETYDPYVPAFAQRPTGLFDFISCVEVVEHSTSPLLTFQDIASLLADPGLVLFTTLIQPDDILRQGTNWWYAAPRNGHVSLHTKMSMAIAAGAVGLKAGTFDEATHGLFKTFPEWAQRVMKPVIHTPV